MRVPDIEEIYEAHERREAAELAKYPKCDWCGEQIFDLMLYVIDDELVCERCISECRHHTDLYFK